jgi:ubiquinone/menaquinone biosynthesis C-methylase UbiE
MPIPVVPPEEASADARPRRLAQCRNPTGWWGRFTLWRMNRSHSKLTDWGLAHVAIGRGDTILDVGCGGGRTVSKLAAVATQGKVFGIDHSAESVAASTSANAAWITLGRVEIRHGSVSRLPFPDDTFHLVTAVETHFFWPDLAADMREVLRVLKPGGTLVLVAEIYRGGKMIPERYVDKFVAMTGMTLLTIDEHRELFARAGYADIEVFEERGKSWICGTGRKSIP